MFTSQESGPRPNWHAITAPRTRSHSPPLTDTFGLVMLESLACGTPVAALPVLGPVDVIGNSGAGVLHEDLGVVCLPALDISREKARRHAEQFSWQASIDQFVQHLAPI